MPEHVTVNNQIQMLVSVKLNLLIHAVIIFKKKILFDFHTGRNVLPDCASGVIKHCG